VFWLCKQRGISLIEILVSLAVIAMMTALLYPGFGYSVRFVERIQTQARLHVLATAFRQAYEDNAINVDGFAGASANGGTLYFPGQPGGVYTYRFTTARSANLSNVGATVQSGFRYLAQHGGASAKYYAVDGFSKPIWVFISNTLYAKWNGYPVYYHNVAFVSSVGNPSLNPGTSFNASTGALTLGGHDLGTVVSGLAVETGLYQSTLDTLHAVAQVYGQIFTSQYLNSTARDPTVDYFSKAPPGASPSVAAQFDGSSPISNSCGYCGGWSYRGDPYPGSAGIPQTDFSQVLVDCQPATVLGGFARTMGYGAGQLNSAFGEPIAICNGPNADGRGRGVRNPDSATSNRSRAPYTALVEAWASDRVVLSVPVVGNY
jgi:prepilin-type N-terminal cleavage/methylation domain-containing protein